jgi:hypothetical protein
VPNSVPGLSFGHAANTFDLYQYSVFKRTLSWAKTYFPKDLEIYQKCELGVQMTDLAPTFGTEISAIRPSQRRFAPKRWMPRRSIPMLA